MCPHPRMMTPNDIFRYAAVVLEPHLHWQDQGPKCTVNTLLQVLFYAAGQLCSLFAACGHLRDAPSDQAVRNALAALCPQTFSLERQLNQSLAAQLPNAVRDRRWRLAVDLNLRPYHGQPHRHAREIYRSQAKSATTHFHAYATCYLVKNKRRYTLALTRVEHGEALNRVLRGLLRRAA